MKALGRAGVHAHAADACRELGLVTGDTIQARVKWCACQPTVQRWSDTRLTLLWLGQRDAIWRCWHRNHFAPTQWEDFGERSNWMLSDRDWHLVDAGEAKEPAHANITLE